MVKEEYLRFLQTLNNDKVSDDVRKIANLIFRYIEVLIPLSTNKGIRIKKTVELAQTDWKSINPEIQPERDYIAKQESPISKIKKLSVGPFRGFKEQDSFDLFSEIVLIYGPNGTGKSSFCEALEYALLGNVNEAESKRFRNQNDYFKNAHVKKFEEPILIGANQRGDDIPIVADEQLYRFCFIEKNRIDNFSRIAAQSPAKQSELISTLFGLESFTEFVHNFVESMNKYIDLEGVKANELNLKKQDLIVYKQQLETIIPEELRKLDEEENDLANEFQVNSSFHQIVFDINGSEDKKGLIALLEDEVHESIGIRSNLTLSNLRNLQKVINTDISNLKIMKQEMENASQQISFKKLYEAVILVQENSAERCPTCLTPLAQTTINPFTYAESELKKLHHLGELQASYQKLEESIRSSMKKILQILDSCCSIFSKNNQLLTFQIVEEDISIEWWNFIHQELSNGLTAWDNLEHQVKNLEDMDKQIIDAEKNRTEKQNELKRLRSFAEKILKFQTRRETINNTKKKAELAIAEFEIENIQLIADVETEKSAVAQNHIIANAYTSFVNELNAYSNNLPNKLVADLGEIVVQLYNSFNRNDIESEQLAVIRLPILQNQRLEIAFKNNSDVFYDALHVLSEGHIRCIGLAILMAKNINASCPFLIFDDPVNAIDDDHRESIRRTMFEDSYLINKQIILACHGEEFFKDIQNLLPVEKAKAIRTVSFLPHHDQNICVDHKCSPRNYIIAASTHIEKNEKRDALDKSRKALESLVKNKVWQYVNKYGDGNLSLKLRSATAPIELRNLTEQLKSKILKEDFSDSEKNAVLLPLEMLLGVDGGSREWRYLNKGTHEEADRTEFDGQIVKEIVIALEQLDNSMKYAMKR